MTWFCCERMLSSRKATGWHRSVLEHRFIAGLEVAGRTLRGRAIRYGDEARIVTATGRPARGAIRAWRVR